MATRRMMTRLVTDDDNFMALSASAQALYLHLNMGADDDGFNNQVTISMFKAHASIDDLKSLLEKRYIYQFENGVIVIKHWRMANALRKDRYTPTVWQEEFKQLQIKDNDAYTLNGNQMATNWQPNGNQMATQISIGKEREEKVNISGAKDTTTRTTEKHHFVKPSVDDVALYFIEKGSTRAEAEHFYDYYESNGWTIGRQAKKMSDWKASVRNWLRNNFSEKQPTQNKRLPDFKSPYKSVIEEPKPITFEEEEIKGRYVVDEDYVLPEPPTIMDFGIYCRDHNLLGVNPPKIHATYISNGQWKEGIKYFDMETACKRAYRGINGIPEEFYQLPKKWEDEE